MSEAVHAEAVQRYGAPKRVLLVVVGSAMVLAGGITSGLLVALLVSLVADGKLAGSSGLMGAVVILFAVFLFGAFAIMGGVRVVSGLQGRPRQRAAMVVQAESWYQRNWYIIGLVAWGTLSGIFLAGGASSVFARQATSPARLPWLAFLAFLVLPVHVSVHELGHAACAALAGFNSVETRIGWFAVRHERGRLRFSWTPPPIQGVLGFHIALPQGGAGLTKRWAVIAGAGPVVTLGVALACRFAGTTVERSSVGLAMASDLLSVGWWVGVALAASNAVPFRLRSGVQSDGAIVMRAMLPGSAAREAEIRFLTCWAQGRRPRDWGVSPEAFLRVADAAKAGRERLLLAALCVALDTGDEVRTNDVLQRVASGIPSRDSLMRYELELQVAMVEAFRGNAARARERLDDLGPHPSADRYSWLAEAVVQAAEGRVAESSETLAGWESAIARTGSEASVRVGNEWALELLRERLATR
jgi:hypothetical protein